MTLEEIRDLPKQLRKSEVLYSLITSHDGRNMSLDQFVKDVNTVPTYSEELKALSVNDILEFAEKEKLITIHREKFKEQ